MTHYLVTGGSGFIGTHLVNALLESGNTVRVFDQRPPDHAGVAFQQGDLRNQADLQRAVAGIETIVHLAAIASVAQSVEDPRTTLDVNVTGTADLIAAATAAKVRRIVFASSAAVYGDPGTPLCSEDGPLRPVSPYAVSKLAGERLLQQSQQQGGPEGVSLRFFNVYGAGQDPSSPYSGVISRFVDAAGRGERPVIFGDGQQTRDFIHVADLVQAIQLAAEKPAARGAVINIASGQTSTITGLWTAIANALDSPLAPEFQPERAGDLRHSLADVSRARELLAFEASISLEQGIANLLAGAG